MINNNFEKKLKSKEFVFTAETSPPDSTVRSEITDRILCLKDLADAINVTDGASAKSHLSSLVVSSIIKDIEIEPILQLTTRDRNRIAIQSDLLGAWTLNIQNILCIYGDQVETGDQPETKEVRDLDTLGVINTANYFKKEKKFPSGRSIKSAPEFFIGGADTPFEIDYKFDCANLIKKIEQGVNFFQTQYAFDAQILKKYMDRSELSPEDILDNFTKFPFQKIHEVFFNLRYLPAIQEAMGMKTDQSESYLYNE